MSNHAPEVFSRLLEDEPSFSLDISPALAAGARKRRHHRALTASTAGFALTAVAVSLALTLPGSTPSGTIAGGSGSVSPAPLIGKTSASTSLTSLAAYQSAASLPAGSASPELVSLVKANSPASFSFSYTGHRTAADALDGTASDAAGAGMFFLLVDNVKGQQPYPCDSFDAANGIICKEHDQDGLHILQHTFTPAAAKGVPGGRHVTVNGGNAMTSVDVSVSLPDGRTVLASSANYTLGDLTAAAQKLGKDGTNPVAIPDLAVDANRANPTFSLDQLTSLAIAVSKAQLQ